MAFDVLLCFCFSGESWMSCAIGIYSEKTEVWLGHSLAYSGYFFFFGFCVLFFLITSWHVNDWDGIKEKLCVCYDHGINSSLFLKKKVNKKKLKRDKNDHFVFWCESSCIWYKSICYLYTLGQKTPYTEYTEQKWKFGPPAGAVAWCKDSMKRPVVKKCE